MVKPRLGVGWFLVLVVVVLGAIRWRFGGVAPRPHAFESHLSLDEGLALSEQTGKPLLVLASADWCGPCQVLKRGALSDPSVAGWIMEHTIPVYADFTDPTTPDAVRAQRLLGIEAYPTLAVVKGGGVTSRRVGVASKAALRAWLQQEAR